MVEEELDETAYWLELIMELELVKPDLLQDLYLENKELLKIVVKSILTMRDKVNGKSIIYRGKYNILSNMTIKHCTSSPHGKLYIVHCK